MFYGIHSKLLPGFLVCCALSFAVSGASPERRPKLIEFSWSSPTTGFLRKNIRTMEANAPYDGIGIHVIGEFEADGKKQLATHFNIFDATPWEIGYFAKAVEDLKHTRFEKFTDNFIRTTATPGTVDLFSDREWKILCDKFAIMSRIARECGMKGLSFDIEAYKHPLFDPGPYFRKGYSYKDVAAKMRQRGKEFSRAVFKEYPDQTFFCFFWLSICLNHTQPGTKYALFYPFLNGFYEELPPEATVIDGNEFNGYQANSREDFQALRIREEESRCLAFLEPANRQRFFRQTQPAPAFYLDSYLCPKICRAEKTFHKTLPEGTGNLVDHLHRNLQLAAEVTPQYIWTWGQEGSWWPSKYRLWETLAPGAYDAVALFRDPVAYAGKKIARKKTENLVRNPDFELPSGENGAIPCWTFWQPYDFLKKSVELKLVPGDGFGRAAFLQSVYSGCLVQTVKNIKPGFRYLVTAAGKGKHIQLFASFNSRRGKWDGRTGKHLMVFSDGGPSGWRSAKAVITAPPDAESLGLLLMNLGGEAWFDRIGVYEL